MIKLLLLMLLGFSFIAYAEDDSELSQIRTKTDVIKMLNIKHLDDVHFDWQDIDHHCMKTVGFRNRVVFHRCLYKNAKTMVTFIKNSTTCHNDAIIGIHVKNTINISNTVNVANDQDSNKHQGITITGDVAYRRCMRDAGWNDPNDWQAGKIK